MSDLHKLLFLISILFLSSHITISQNLFQKDKFTFAPTFEGKVVLLKNIDLKNTDSDKSFETAKAWAKNAFGKDLFVSSVRVREKEKTIYIQSKINLLLPANKANISEKVSMNYRLHLKILNNKCIVEIKDINYNLRNVVGINLLRKYYSAEEMITQEALKLDDSLSELRQNLTLSTFYFFNQLVDEGDKNLNHSF